MRGLAKLINQAGWWWGWGQKSICLEQEGIMSALGYPMGVLCERREHINQVVRGAKRGGRKLQ